MLILHLSTKEQVVNENKLISFKKKKKKIHTGFLLFSVCCIVSSKLHFTIHIKTFDDLWKVLPASKQLFRPPEIQHSSWQTDRYTGPQYLA